MNKQISKRETQISKGKMSISKSEIRKQNSQQDVGFDKEVAILRVRGVNRQYPISPQIRWNSQWEEMNKLETPLEKIIEHYVLDLRSQNKSMKTIDWYAANLRAFIRWLRRHKLPATLADFNADTVRSYIIYLQDEHRIYQVHPYVRSGDKPLSDHSIQGYVRTLRALSSWLYREQYIDDNPIARIRVPKALAKEIKPLTNEEISKILSCLNPQTATGSRSYAIIYLMLDAGLRISEVSTLKMENVDFERGHLLVRGKGNKERMVPMGINTQKFLQRYVYHFRPEPVYPEHDNVFLMFDGRPVNSNTLKLLFTRLKRKTGIKRLHAHLLRHTFATYYLRNGGDLVSLQKILGHTTLEMAKVYLHLAESDVSIKHRQYSPMDRIKLRLERPIIPKQRQQPVYQR